MLIKVHFYKVQSHLLLKICSFETYYIYNF